MKAQVAGPGCLALGAMLCGCSALGWTAPPQTPGAPVTVVNHASNPVPVINVNPDGASAFTVPFFIEQTTATPVKPSLRADFRLARPAILESIAVQCGGHALGSVLYVDGGPLGLNGVTGVGSTADVGLVVGLIGDLLSPILLPMQFPPGSGPYVPVTHIGVPVKSSYSFLLYQDTAAGTASCFGNVVLRSLS